MQEPPLEEAGCLEYDRWYGKIILRILSLFFIPINSSTRRSAQMSKSDMTWTGIGFETIGNAILICYDSNPVLVTDPWIVGGAYFQSWTFSHEIPQAQLQAIQQAKYVWLSHGHPDHLSGPSLKLLKGKKILLPDHSGGRIYHDLVAQGYEVHILKDRLWTQLSDRVRVLTLTDYNQDAILLVDLNGRLIINANDASDRGWGYFVRREAWRYKISFLLSLSGFNDADMMNYFDETGKRIPPLAARKRPFGGAVARRTERLGASYFIPFSSMHRYQREDSLWANEYTASLSDYALGFKSRKCEILPAYIRYDCSKDTYEEIQPPQRKWEVVDPESIGDSWKDPLESTDLPLIDRYFKSIQHLKTVLGFIHVQAGGKEHVVTLNPRIRDQGITFQAPRHSLMTAIQLETFDDLLIGNFMKTTLHGKQGKGRLYPDFTPYVAKYADNGRAKTKEELHEYFEAYRRRAFFDYIRKQFESRSSALFWSLVPLDSKLYQVGKIIYERFKKTS